MLQTRHQSCIAEPRLSLQSLDLTTSRSLWSDSGEGAGGARRRELHLLKGYLRYTDPGAPASCGVRARRSYSAENIQSDVCVEITVSCGALTIEVSQSGEQQGRGGGGEWFAFFFINIPCSYTNNKCQCSTWSLVRAATSCQKAQQHHPHPPFFFLLSPQSVITVPLNTFLVFH